MARRCFAVFERTAVAVVVVVVVVEVARRVALRTDMILTSMPCSQMLALG